MTSPPNCKELLKKISTLEKELSDLKNKFAKSSQDMSPLLHMDRLVDGNIFEMIIENAPLIVDAFDKQGNCILWNKKGEEFLGWTKEELIKTDDPLALFYPDPSYRKEFLQTIQEADGQFREFRLKAKNGNIMIQEWAIFQLSDNSHIDFGIDITEKRNTENKLKQNEARFRAFTQAIPDILFVFDEDGQYIEIFTSASELLVDDLAALKGSYIKNSLPKEVAQQHADAIKKTIQTQKSQSFEYVLDVPKGRCWFESRTAPILGPEGEKRFIASSVRDITDRKLSEKEINEKERLTAVMETAGAVCHELNQPLQIISGCCELLEDIGGLDEKNQRKIDIIMKETQRMAKLNHDLMNITSYKTKFYLKTKIIDIKGATESSNTP